MDRGRLLGMTTDKTQLVQLSIDEQDFILMHCQGRGHQQPTMSPQLIYGTATFGMDMTEIQTAEAAKKMLETVRSLGISRLDTAPRYPPLSRGRAEELLGQASELSGTFAIDTKVYTDTGTDGSGDLGRNAVHESVRGSLERLNRPQVRRGFLPDRTT